MEMRNDITVRVERNKKMAVSDIQKERGKWLLDQRKAGSSLCARVEEQYCWRCRTPGADDAARRMYTHKNDYQEQRLKTFTVR